MADFSNYKLERATIHEARVHSLSWNHYGWALFTINDRTGLLQIASDWGDWSYRWHTNGLGEGETLTTFLAHADDDYIARKLCVDRDELDLEQTHKYYRGRICEMRRNRDLRAEEARELWDALEDWYEENTERQTPECWEDPKLWEYFEYTEYWHKPTHKFLVLKDFLIPALKEELKKL